MGRGWTPKVVAVGSVVAFAAVVAGLYLREPAATSSGEDRPLVVYVAASARPPMEAIAADYQRETGRRVELRFGASEDILQQLLMGRPADPADLFLPADDSYISTARDRGMVADVIPVAAMRGVVLTAPGNPRNIANWADLLGDGVKVAVPNANAAVGKLARERLAADGRWAALEPHAVGTGTVTEAANAAKVGGVPAAIVWDAVAARYPGQTILPLPELAGVTARVQLAVLTQAPDPAAAHRFARYVTASDRGLPHFQNCGFRTVSASYTWADLP